MRLLQTARNLVETNRLAERAYNAAASAPGYRAFVFRRIRERIAEVRERRRYSLMIETSSVCNARCTFCPHAAMKREKRVMDDETFDLIVSKLTTEKIDPPIIDLFCVGEPLTDRKLPERIRRLRALFPHARIGITTNFALANDGIVDALLQSGLNIIRISLNAASPDRYRALMGLDYAKTVRNIHRLVEKRNGSPLSVVVSMVVSPESKDEARAFVKLWDSEAVSILLQRSHDWLGALDRPTFYAPARLYPCNDLFERIPILSNGDLALCCADAEGTGANIRNAPILDLFNSQRFPNMRDLHLTGKIDSLTACRNCFGVHNNGGSWVFRAYR